MSDAASGATKLLSRAAQHKRAAGEWERVIGENCNPPHRHENNGMSWQALTGLSLMAFLWSFKLLSNVPNNFSDFCAENTNIWLVVAITQQLLNEVS